jgi:RimJ/RimL family protein N-acetyltransferase
MAGVRTERLVLRPFDVAEAERVVAGQALPGPAWARDYPSEYDIVGLRGFLARCEVDGEPQPFGAYQIIHREHRMAIGGLGFHGPPDPAGAVTIGYGVVPSARGRGYATEALRGLLGLARDLRVRCVRGDTTQANTASQAVMTGADMRLVRQDAESRYYEITW